MSSQLPSDQPQALGELWRRVQILEAIKPDCNCPTSSGVVATGSSVYDVMYATDLDGSPLFDFLNSSLFHCIDFAFDHWNNIYVVNLSNAGASVYPIYKFNSAGTFLTTLGTANTGSANGQCSSPTAMCFDSVGNMYIVDAGNDRIQKWDASGSYLSKWGTTGSGNGQFSLGGGSSYAYIAYDGTYLYVGDTGNHRVQKFNTSGTYQTKWGSNGTGNGQFTTLNGIAVSTDGTIYVVDDYWNPGSGNNSRIQYFDSTGTYLGQYDSPTYGSADGEFEHPNDISIDDNDNIYVVDEYNGRIQKLSLPGFTFVTKWDVPPDIGGNPQGIAVRPNAVPI